jgi:uncharacterized protein YjiK
LIKQIAIVGKGRISNYYRQNQILIVIKLTHMLDSIRHLSVPPVLFTHSSNMKTTQFTSVKFLIIAISSAIATSVVGCGGSSTNKPAISETPVALAAPTLAFTDPQSTYDLANYTQTGRYSLPVGTGANVLAEEASGVTFNKDTNTLFVVGDGGTSVTQVTKQGVLVDSMTLAADAGKPQGTYFYDPEGIAYIGNGKFVLVEERFRQFNEFTYVPNTTLAGTGVRTVKIGTTIGNIGIEGFSTDPKTNGYIVVKESGPAGVFQTTLDFAAGTASNGSSTTENSTNLFDPTKTGLSAHNDVFALSNIVPTTAADYEHILILSAPDGKIVKMDRAGKILSTLNVGSAPQNEGMTMDQSGNIYVVSEVGGGAGKPEMLVFSPTTTASAVGAGDTRTISIGDTSQITFSGNTVTINPTANLLSGSSYSVTYAAGVLKDSKANPAPTITGTTLSFAVVGTTDKTAPALVSTTPTDNATEITRSRVILTFNEAVVAGTGNIVFTATTGASDVRTLAVDDITQVTFSGNTVNINPSADLRKGTSYNVQLAAGVIKDPAGNAFAGITSPTALNFDTAAAPVVAPVTPSLLITEVNSNAAGGDFFEIYNYGSAAVDLTGWKWDDDSASFTDAGNATFTSISIPAGERLVVVNTTDVAAFRTAWGLANTVPVIGTGGPGLGGGDAVVLFDTAGKVIASFNYKGGATAMTATDGTVIAPAAASAGVTASLPNHAGIAYGGSSGLASAVWDGVSTSAPTYKVAVVGVLSGFAQPSVTAAVGSPGQ